MCVAAGKSCISSAGGRSGYVFHLPGPFVMDMRSCRCYVAEWWEAHQPLVVFMWIHIILVVPFCNRFMVQVIHLETVLDNVSLNDLSGIFIVLLFGLFCVSGNMYSWRRFCRITESKCMSAGHWVHCFPAVLEQREPSAHGSRRFIKMNSWRKKKKDILWYFSSFFSDFQYGWAVLRQSEIRRF